MLVLDVLPWLFLVPFCGVFSVVCRRCCYTVATWSMLGLGSLALLDCWLMASHEAISHATRGSIRAWCRAQDIGAVIGRFVVLDGRGVGSCPFKEHHYRGDRRPSFQVFGGTDPHWYCYTWGRAGDLFDFLCLSYQITPQEAWRRLQDGVLMEVVGW